MPDRLVLGYHAVSNSVPSQLTVTRAKLRRQVTSLVERGYVATTFNRLVLDSGGARRFAVTFDDGERSVLEHAYEVMTEVSGPATVFVPVSPVGAPGLLSWDDLAVLADAGWEIGSHTLTHARLTDLDDSALARELRTSREAIEQALGVPCRSIAYPYGAYDLHVRAAAAAAGFTAGCTTDATRAGDVLGWPRVGIDGADGQLLFRLKTSRIGRVVRGTALGPPLQRAGRAARALASR